MSDLHPARDADPGPSPKSKARAKGKAKAAAKGKARARPELDLDKEISEANLLANMSRKLMNAAKNLERSNKRSKSRLIRKAGKLTAEDLERIAVLKRCGLYAEDDDADDRGDTDSQSAASGSASSSSQPALGHKKQKLMDILSAGSDPQSLLQGVAAAFPSLTSASTGKPPSDSASVLSAPSSAAGSASSDLASLAESQ